MPAVSLRPISPANRDAVAQLVVAPGQSHFVASNRESLDEADGNSACVPFAIIADGVAVGFAMYALDPDDGNYWIYRLMIDARQQGKGIGRAALGQLVDIMSGLPDCPRIMLGVVPDNVAARRLCESCDFVATGEIIGGEEVMCLTL